jgi:asparagine synthetase B (glutamine-hydrolysing)
MNQKLHHLKESFALLKSMPFPSSIDDALLGDLHAELAEYDGYVVGILETVLSAGQPGKEDVDSARQLTKALESTQDARVVPLRDYLKQIKACLKAAEEAGLIHFSRGK